MKGIRWFAFGTDDDGLASPEKCPHVGSHSSAYWPFENVQEIGVTPRWWNRLNPAPYGTNHVVVGDVKVVWVGNMDGDGTTVHSSNNSEPTRPLQKRGGFGSDLIVLGVVDSFHILVDIPPKECSIGSNLV